MSSESEDEFQSADEGSGDDETKQPVVNTAKPAPQQQPLGTHDERKVAAVSHTDAIVGNSGIASNSQPESRPQEGSSSDVHHAVADSEEHIVSESSHIKDSHEEREASSAKDDVECVIEDQNTTEKESDRVRLGKADTKKHDREADDDNDKTKVIDTGLEICSTTLRDLKISDEMKHLEDGAPVTLSEEGEMTVKKIQEETKRDQKFTENCDTELRKENEVVSEPAKLEGIADSSSPDTARKDLNCDVRSKQPRESRIGMKKPREKLGERLGAKKLGSRVDKKSLEGLSSDDIASRPRERDDSKKNPTDNQGRDDANQERKWEAERKKEMQLEEERWQQIQHQQETTQLSDDGGSSSGWGGSWEGWGSSLLSAASTFTKEVGRGVGTVMETVESGLGVPDAETMAREIVEQKKMEEKEEHTADAPSTTTGENPASSEGEESSKVKEAGQGGLGGMWLGSWVSGVSGALETAGNKVLLGGLDTLEVIGRKAMDAIQEGDPGLRKKRAFLTNNKPNLSQVLQDARVRAVEEEKIRSVSDGEGARGVTLEAAWDGREGGVHLEALSLVARQCEAKNASMMATLPHFLLNSLSSSNSEIKSACEVGEEGDMEGSLEGDLNQHIAAIITHTTLPLNISRLSQAWSTIQELEGKGRALEDGVDESELYTGVAEVVAQVVALTHKAAEMALITPQVDPLKLATNFRQLSCSVWGSVEGLTDRICGSITSSASAPDAQVNDTITNIYLQVSHGSRYIQQSMGYLSPVLQYVNTKRAAANV